MSSEESVEQRLSRVVDDLEIRRCVADYAARVDARSWDALHDVFAPDVVVHYHNGRTRVDGANDVVDYIKTNTAHLAWQHHFVSTYRVDIAADAAVTQAYLISHQVLTDEPSHVLTMAATYDFELRRIGKSWRISEMTHHIKTANFLPITHEPPSGAHVPPPVRHDNPTSGAS